MRALFWLDVRGLANLPEMALDPKSILWSGRYDGSYEATTCLGKHRMPLQTILNRVKKHKSHLFGRVRLVSQRTEPPTIEVELRTRGNSRAICSSCGRKVPCYDQLPLRRFKFEPLWGMAVFFLYAFPASVPGPTKP